MKAWEYDAVTYDCAVYCVDCLPDGVSVNSEDVRPIFASDEWSYPGPTCDHCGTVHDYMGIIGRPEYRLWSIVNGALEDDYTYEDSDERDIEAHKLVTEMRTCLAPWQVYVADVTSGYAVGEWSGEHAVLFASGVGGQGTPD